jgi:protein-disulfide isomerase
MHIYKKNISLLLSLVLFFLTPTLSAEGISKQQADDILLELKQIRQLLENQTKQSVRAAAPAAAKQSQREVSFSLEGKIILGDKNAPVILVEFTDYQCSFCRKFHTEVFNQLKTDYIDTGKLAFINRDLPLGFHNNAMHAAQAAHCANKQDKYWELRDTMILNANKLSRDDISGYAEKLKLNVAKLNQCIDSNTHQKLIDNDIADAGTAGISGTPTFVFAKNTGGENITGQIVVGVKPLGFFEDMIAGLSSMDKKQVVGENRLNNNKSKEKNAPSSKNYRLDTGSNELVLIERDY